MEFEAAKQIVLADVAGSAAEAVATRRAAWLVIGQRANAVKAAHPEAKTRTLSLLYREAGLSEIHSVDLASAAWFDDFIVRHVPNNNLDDCPYSRSEHIHQWLRDAGLSEIHSVLLTDAAWFADFIIKHVFNNNLDGCPYSLPVHIRRWLREGPD